MRVAVIGHVEWIRFARVDRVPAAGEIAHSFDEWEQAGGGGGVAAVQLALLADETHLFTALGNDELGRRSLEELRSRGVVVHAAPDDRPQRWAFVHVDESGERTITTVGPKQRPRGHDDRLPWHELASMDAVFFVAGDADALVHALIGSGEDEAERFRSGELDPPPRLVVTTSGALGGWARPGGPYTAAEPPGEVVDAYGAGDSFAAGLTYALAAGLEPQEALAFAARCGAGALAGRGVAPRHVAMPAAAESTSAPDPGDQA
jgi:ribokinase